MDVEVTGFGIICAIGNDAKAVLSSLKAGKTGISPMHYLQSVHKELPVGEVKLSNEEMKRMLGQDENTVISRTVLMGAIAIRQALEQANLNLKGKRVAVINGTTVAGMDITERFFKQIKDNDALLPLLEKHDCGSSTREMAELAGLKEAQVCTVSTACSSAVNAIILGSEMLKNNETDIVIAGGTEALSLFHLNGFNSLMILDKEQCRPFDKSRAGLNLGEGAAFVVLKASPPTPLRGEGSIVIRGYGNRCDAFHQTASSENGEGAFLAMSDALQMAGLKPEEIHYINAHGTGTPNNDASESAAIRRVFGEKIPPVSSTKGFTGHTTSASGSIETVICILALQHGFLPANLGWKEQDESCITPAPSPLPLLGSAILCNSFGFGGNDSALVIGASHGPSKGEGKHQDAEACVLAEAVINDVEQLGELREFVSAGEARRMSKLMKAATISSMKALQAAGIESPDAIITATAHGMLETSEKFLVDMLENGEETLSPTLFMQSTHNTLSSAIAIRTKCHGYNMTYSQDDESLEWALRDARRLIETDKAKTVLVGCHDEATPTFQEFYRRMGKPVPQEIYSRSIVLGTAKNA
ncbi:MAG: beta-ketoacyl-[acyl-carrier-protein] synthase family protein [Bacteroidaceae bacterium]|nr:beta-ketoacyl-[acyl-carrier-protein] synthase family protein [Bacteroidaceae bacterium]